MDTLKLIEEVSVSKYITAPNIDIAAGSARHYYNLLQFV